MIKLIVCSLLLLSVAQAQTADCKNDWPNLARYDKDNKTVAPPAKNEQRVVFMGDSITDSWDSPNNGGFFLADHTSIAASAAKRRRRCSFAFGAT